MTGRFALFADCLLIGLFTALAALPVVTAYPAFVAACAMLRDGTPVGPFTYLRCLRNVLRSLGWRVWIPPLLAVIAIFDAVAVASGVPGAKPLTVLLFLVAAAVAVVALRSAGRWQPAAGWRSILRDGSRAAARDLGGSALILFALACAFAIVAFVPVTALLVTGPLALATVAVESRSSAGDDDLVAVERNARG